MWKRVLQVFEVFNVEVWESVWKKVFRVVESFNIEVWGVREFFQVVERFKFQVCQKEFFANPTSFKPNFKFVQESFSSVWGFLVKVLFCDI